MRFVKNLCWLQIRLLQRIYKESKKHHVRQRAHCILLSAIKELKLLNWQRFSARQNEPYMNG